MTGRTAEDRRQVEEAIRPYRQTLRENPDWKKRAKCNNDPDIDPDFFFPDAEGGVNQETAKAIEDYCEGCPVQEECLAYALIRNDKFGYWGGKSRNQRDYIRRQEGLPPFPSRACGMCGGEFWPRNVSQKVCGDECSDRYYKLKRARKSQVDQWMESSYQRGERGMKVDGKQGAA